MIATCTPNTPLPCLQWSGDQGELQAFTRPHELYSTGTIIDQDDTIRTLDLGDWVIRYRDKLFVCPNQEFIERYALVVGLPRELKDTDNAS